jgi:hypothetical protein
MMMVKGGRDGQGANEETQGPISQRALGRLTSIRWLRARQRQTRSPKRPERVASPNDALVGELGPNDPVTLPEAAETLLRGMVKASTLRAATARGRLLGAKMRTIFTSGAFGILTFGLGIFGLFLQRLLPENHMSSGSRDMIGAIMGLVSLLLALVLGTLVGSAYGFFATQKANVETLGARTIQLDMALAQYGPEAQPLRDGVKAATKGAYHTIWGGGDTDQKEFDVESYLPMFQRMNEGVSALKPQTPAQTQLIPTIGVNVGVIEQTRLLMSLQLASPVSWPLLIVVVSWSMLLFCGFGVLSRLNATSVAALALGSFAVASAVFLILELNEPFTGLLRVPGASVAETIRALGG